MNVRQGRLFSCVLSDKDIDCPPFSIAVPNLVSLLARSPYDVTLWIVIKDIINSEGECFLSSQDLATYARMSVGKLVECRKYLLEVGLLEGEIRHEPGHARTWHLRIPDEWRPQTRFQEQQPTPGYVYLLKSGEFYKIGASSNVSARIKQLTAIPPFGVSLVCTIKTNDMYQLERQLHEQFASKRVSGEWFELTDQDVAIIEACKGGTNG